MRKSPTVIKKVVIWAYRNALVYNAVFPLIWLILRLDETRETKEARNDDL